MNKLILLFAFISLCGCQPDNQPVAVATGALGRYLVTAYIVSGDTLFSSRPTSTGFMPGINKIGVDNFNIVINQIGSSDQVSVSTSYWKNGLRSTFTKEAVVSLADYQYQLSPIKEYTPSSYEATVERDKKVFYERTVGRGALLIPVANAPINATQPPSQEIIVVAQPQR